MRTRCIAGLTLVLTLTAFARCSSDDNSGKNIDSRDAVQQLFDATARGLVDLFVSANGKQDAASVACPGGGSASIDIKAGQATLTDCKIASAVLSGSLTFSFASSGGVTTVELQGTLALGGAFKGTLTINKLTITWNSATQTLCWTATVQLSTGPVTVASTAQVCGGGTGDGGGGDGDAGSGDVGSGDVGSGDVASGDVGSGDVGSSDVGSGDVGGGADLNTSAGPAHTLLLWKAPGTTTPIVRVDKGTGKVTVVDADVTLESLIPDGNANRSIPLPMVGPSSVEEIATNVPHSLWLSKTTAIYAAPVRGTPLTDRLVRRVGTTWTALHSVPATGSSLHGLTTARGAALGAFTPDGKTVNLIKLDGSTFAGGKVAVDITPTWTVDSIRRIFFAKARVYIVTLRNTPREHRLWQAPRDGSAKAKEVTGFSLYSFYNPGGGVNGAFSVSADGTKVAIKGESNNTQGWFLIDDASAATQRLTSTGFNVPPGDGTLLDAGHASAKVALSSAGSYFAYVDGTPPNEKLEVLNIGGATTTLLPSATFNGTVTGVNAVQWLDDTRLIFYLRTGTTTEYYLYDATKGISAIKKMRSAAAPPPFGAGGLQVERNWRFLDPSGRYIFALMPTAAGTTVPIDLLVIDRMAGTAKVVSGGGAQLSNEFKYWSAAPGQGIACVRAKTMSSGFWDVYAVDLNKQTVTNLTKVSANQNIELTAASASPDGKWCSYLAIPAANVKQRRLYLVSTAGGSAPKTLGPLGGVYGNNRWASDSSGLYFIHGTATKDRVLKYATVTGAVSTAVKTYAGTDLLILAAE